MVKHVYRAGSAHNKTAHLKTPHFVWNASPKTLGIILGTCELKNAPTDAITSHIMKIAL